ncbi:MAG: hypothetical protein ACRD2G_06790 [Terriglobia bacterium]
MALQKQETSLTSGNGISRQAALTAAEAQRLQAEAKALVSEFQEKLQQTLHLFKLKAAKQVARELPGIAGKLLEQFTSEYQKLASETAGQLRADLKAAGHGVSQETAEQLAEIREDALNGFLTEAKVSIDKTLSEAAGLLQEQNQAFARSADAALRSVEAAAGEASSRLQAAREQIESSVLSEHKKRLAELAASGRNADTALRLIEAAAAEATIKLQSAREQMESSLLADHQKRLADLAVSSSNADTAMRAVQGAAGEAAAKLWAAGEQMESSLAAEYQKRVQEITASSLNDLAHKAQVSVDGFEEQLEGTLSAFKRKATARIDEDIAKATAGLLDRSAGQLQQQTDEVREKLLADLRDSGSTVLEETRRHLGKIEKASSEILQESARAAAEKAVSQAAIDVEEQAQAAISRSADLAVSKISAAQKTLQTQAELCLTDHQRQLASVSVASIEGAQRKLDSHLESFRGQIEQRCGDAREKLLADLKDSGSIVLEETRRHLGKIEKSSSEILHESARAAAEKAVSQAAKKAEEQAQAAISRNAELAVSKIGAEQKALQTQAELSVKDHQKQLTAVLAANVESAQRKLDSHLETFEEKLQAAAGTLEQKILDSGRQDFPRAAAELAEAAAAGMEKQAGQMARQVEEKIQASGAALAEKACRQAAGEAENSLRSMRETAVEQARSQMQQLFKEMATASRAQFDTEIEQSIRKQRRSAQAQMDEVSRASLERLRSVGPQVVAAVPASRASHFLLILVALIPTVLFVYLASRPMMRLAPNAPADFVEAYPELDGAHADTAQKLAQAYWDWAAVHLAPDYPYGSQLPEQPPALFDAEGSGFPTGVEADVARARYWQKLRQLWSNPQSWEKVQVWSRH